MSSGMRSAYETSGSALRPIFTHGAASSTSDNPESAVLLPCFSGARLTSPSRSRLLPLPAEDDVTSAVALAPRCTSALVAGRSGFAVFTPLAAPVGGDAAAPPRRPRSFRPFDNAVVAHAAYDSSGGLLAVAPATGVVHVYDCDAFHVTHAFALRQDLITTAVAFHPDPDAMLLFVGAEDGSIRCFDMATRAKEPVYVATHHVSAVVSLSFVNAGRWLVAAGKDRVLSVSKSRDGAKLHLMAANEDLVGVSALAARPATVVSAGDGGSLRVWDVAAGRELTGLATAVPLVNSSARDGGEGDGGTVENVVSGVVSCGANKFAVTLTDRTLLTFAADADGRLRAERAVCGNLEQINDLCALPSAAASAAEPDFLVASNSPVLWVVRPPAGALDAEVRGVGIGAAGDGDGAEEGGEGVDEGADDGGESDAALDRPGWTCRDVLDGHRGIVLGVDVVTALNSKGKAVVDGGRAPAAYAASGSRDKTARVWQRAASGSWRCIGVAEGHTDAVTAVALSPKTSADNFFVATAANDRTLKVWRLLGAVKGAAAAAAAADGETRIVSGVGRQGGTGGDGVRLTASWTVLAHGKDINAVAVSPDGRIVATGSQDRTVKLWDAESGALKVSCAGHRRGVFDVTFSPVDRVVASASGDATVRVWNAVTGACLRTLQGHEGGVLRAVFMTRGMQLVSSAMDGLVKVWSVRTGECGATVDAHEDAVWALDATRDGAAVVSGGMDGTVRVWCDATAVRAEEAAGRRAEEAALGQRVNDAARARRWAAAADAALRLHMPRKLKAVVAQLVTSTADADGELAAVVRAVGARRTAASAERLGRLLGYCRDWGASGGPASAAVAARVLRAVFRVWTPAGLCAAVAAGRRGLVEALVAHTARHEARAAALAARARLVDYTLEAMRALPPAAAAAGRRAGRRAGKRAAGGGDGGGGAKRRRRGHDGEATAY